MMLRVCKKCLCPLFIFGMSFIILKACLCLQSIFQDRHRHGAISDGHRKLPFRLNISQGCFKITQCTLLLKSKDSVHSFCMLQTNWNSRALNSEYLFCKNSALAKKNKEGSNPGMHHLLQHITLSWLALLPVMMTPGMTSWQGRVGEWGKPSVCSFWALFVPVDWSQGGRKKYSRFSRQLQPDGFQAIVMIRKRWRIQHTLQFWSLQHWNFALSCFFYFRCKTHLIWAPLK